MDGDLALERLAELWPADAVERRAVSSLVPYARNARVHSEDQIRQLMASIEEWGWTIPVLVDETGMLLAGHGRIMAAQRLGIVDVPAMVARGWSEAKKRAYIIADNKLTLNASWDNALLAVEISDLEAMRFDTSLIGFLPGELSRTDGDGDQGGGQGGAGSLAERFGIPPFSVMNAREGWWQDRKRAWLALGIQSDLGRGDIPSTSARVGADDEPTYRTIGGRKANAHGRGRPVADGA